MNALSVQVRRFESGDVQITADVAGPPDGAPVLLLHGGGQTRGAWGGALAEGARRGFLMISADLRDHGESGWSPAGDYSMVAHAADIAAISDALPAPAFLVGASLGGEYDFAPLKGIIYEYACHEGNYALPAILAGARRQEKEAAEAAAAKAAATPAPPAAAPGKGKAGGR